MSPDRATFARILAAIFGSCAAIGAALFYAGDALTNGLAPYWLPLVGPARIALVAIGALGLASTWAFHARRPVGRYAVVGLLSVVGTLWVGYCGAILWFMWHAPLDTFLKGKERTLTAGALLIACSFALLGATIRRVLRDGDD